MHFVKTLLFGILVAFPATARPLRVQDLAKVNGFGTVLRFSPDGRFVAYEVKDWSSTTESYGEFSRIGTPPVGIGCNLWIVDTQSGQARNLTPNQGNNWGPSWSPDGKYLAYYSDRNHKPQLWLWDLAKGGLRLAMEAIVRPYAPMDTVRWTPDGKKILVKLVPEGMSLEELHKLSNITAEPDDASAGKSNTPMVRVYSSKSSPDPREAASRAAQADSVTNAYLSDLGLVDVADGKVERIARRVKPT